MLSAVTWSPSSWTRGDEAATTAARRAVDQAKRALGERGPVWWSDGAPDLNRRLVKNSPYSDWWRDKIDCCPELEA
jgi:hypothetical protein